MNKETMLVHAALNYAACCLAEGDLYALREMGIGVEEAKALNTLTVTDLQRTAISQTRSHFLSLKFNCKVLRLMIEHVRCQREKEKVMLELIECDAPREMLRALYGLSHRDCQGYRQMLGRHSPPGRPSHTDSATAQIVWAEWQKRFGDECDPDLVKPEDWLALHKVTGVPMRTIWNLAQKWSFHGGPGMPAEQAFQGDAATGQAKKVLRFPSG